MSRSQLAAVLPLLLMVACRPEPPAQGADSACCEPVATAAQTPAPAAAGHSLYALDGVWQDQDGHRLHLRDLAGRARVLAMVFTHCEYACPRILSELRALEAELPPAGDGPGFVLVSFDSARDTPDALRAYAERQALPAERWTLLHGDAAAVRELSVLLDVAYREDADGNFAHASVISVLDAEGRLVHQKRGLGGPLDACREAIVATQAPAIASRNP